MVAQVLVNEAGSAGTEGGRRPSAVPAEATAPADPEVVARPARRRLTAAYKLKVLDTVSSLRTQGNGALGAYLRKEGLYYSSIRAWGQQRAQGQLTASKRGPREQSRDDLRAENKQLRRRLEQTQKKLQKTELLVELQKKLCALMEPTGPSSTERSAEA